MATTTATSVRRIPGSSVTPAHKPLPTVAYATALKQALGGGALEAYSRDTKRLLQPPGRGQLWSRSPKPTLPVVHGFVLTVNTAYDHHYPLTLSPDMVWLMLAQGFALHLGVHAEALRGRFVAHEGKATLEVRRDEFVRGFAGNDWEGVFAEFSQQILQHIGDDAHRAIVPTFSTTGIVEKAAFEVTLMDALQAYFDYVLTTRCGIPEFFLEGTPADWRLLRERALALTEYDLEWWRTPLEPLLDELVRASEGTPDPSWWAEFYKRRDGSGGPKITGHLCALFPYLAAKKDVPARPNSSLQNGMPLLTAAQLPSGHSSAPFLWNYLGQRLPMEFVAGFVGATQDPKTLALRPELGWAVRERPT